MHKFISFNYQILSDSEVNLNAVSSAMLYGKGIFTTIAIHNSKPFLWEKHWHRLKKNAGILDIDLSDFGEEKIKKAFFQIIEKNEISEGRSRITFFDENSSTIWQNNSQNKTSVLIQTADFQKVNDNFRLTISPFQINSKSPLTNVKSCNYLEKLLALKEAKKRGFDEAICLNEQGEIASACMANIFWLKDEKLFTPSLKTGCLNGTTREFILEKRKVFEVEEDVESLENAEAIFLTSAGIGIAQVKSFQEKSFSEKSLILNLKGRY